MSECGCWCSQKEKKGLIDFFLLVLVFSESKSIRNVNSLLRFDRKYLLDKIEI